MRITNHTWGGTEWDGPPVPAYISDSSRHNTATGEVGFMLSIAPPDLVDATALTAGYPTRIIASDATFLQGQIIGDGGLNLELKQWGYYGGTQLLDTTWVNGKWSFRWYSPYYVNYQIWHKPYDSSVFSLVGCPYREPVMDGIGDYYASMVVPQTPGHYEIRWIYLNDASTIAGQVFQSFTSMSRGIDAMPDYPYPAGDPGYPTTTQSNLSGNPVVVTLPTYEFKNLGETALFTIQINGSVPGPLSYQWRMNDNNIHDSSSKFSGTTTNTLTVSNITMAEAGSFSCVVSNSVVSTKSWLVVDPP